MPRIACKIAPEGYDPDLHEVVDVTDKFVGKDATLTKVTQVRPKPEAKKRKGKKGK